MTLEVYVPNAVVKSTLSATIPATAPGLVEHTSNRGVASGYPALDTDALVAQKSRASDAILPLAGIIALPHGITFQAIASGAPTSTSNSALVSLADADGSYVTHDTTATFGSMAGVSTDVLASRETIPDFTFDGRSAIVSSVFGVAAAVSNPFQTVGVGTPLMDGGTLTAGTTTIHTDGWTTKPEIGDVFRIHNTGGGTADLTEYTVQSSSALAGTDSDVVISPGLTVTHIDNDVISLIRNRYIPGATLFYDAAIGDNLMKLSVSSGVPLSVTYAADVFVNSSGILVSKTNNWRTAGFKEGMLVTLAGTGLNNGTHRIASINNTGAQITCTPLLTGPDGTTGSPLASVTVSGGGEAKTTTAIPTSANAEQRWFLRFKSDYTVEASVFNPTTKVWDSASLSAGTFVPAGSTTTDVGDKLKAHWFVRNCATTGTGAVRTTSPRSILRRNNR